MHQILVTLHSANRYLILAALIFVLYRSLNGWFGKGEFSNLDKKSGLVLMILADIELLIGLIQYAFTSPYTQAAFADFGAAMKNPLLRYFAVEHISAMVIAIFLIHVGYKMSKTKPTDLEKHKSRAIYTGIAALLIFGTLAMKGILFGSPS